MESGAGMEGARPRRPGLQISLLNLLFLTLAVGGVTMGFLAKREAEALRAENKALRVRVGVLDVEDNTRINLLRVETHEDKWWRFRVFLPPGRKYQMRALTGFVASPAKGGGSMQIEAGEHEVNVRIRPDANGEMRVLFALGGSSLAQGFGAEDLAHLTKGGASMSYASNGVHDAGKPLELMHYEYIPVGKNQSGQRGFSVWIEEAQR